MIEDNPDKKKQSKRITYTSVAFGSKTLVPRNSRSQYIQKNFRQTTWHFLSWKHSVGCIKANYCTVSWQISHTFFPIKVKLHVIICSIWTSKKHTSPVQSTLRLTFSLDWNSESRRRYVSKSGRYPNNTHWSNYIFFECHWREQIFFIQSDNGDYSEEQPLNKLDKLRNNG